MRYILTKQVNRWFRRSRSVSSENMIQAANEVVAGINDGNLTGKLIKKRISREKRYCPQ